MSPLATETASSPQASKRSGICSFGCNRSRPCPFIGISPPDVHLLLISVDLHGCRRDRSSNERWSNDGPPLAAEGAVFPLATLAAILPLLWRAELPFNAQKQQLACDRCSSRRSSSTGRRNGGWRCSCTPTAGLLISKEAATKRPAGESTALSRPIGCSNSCCSKASSRPNHCHQISVAKLPLPRGQ